MIPAAPAVQHLATAIVFSRRKATNTKSSRMTHTSTIAVLLLSSFAAGWGVGADAQALRSETLILPGPVTVQAEAVREETVRLLTGLALIESRLNAGLLFLQDGLTHPEGSHFLRALTVTYPEIKDGLLAAGIADLEPLLAALTTDHDIALINADYTLALTAVLKARSSLNYTGRELLQSVVEQMKLAATEFNPAGPTDLHDYQDAWAAIQVARSELDLLLRSKEAEVAKAAEAMVPVFDDLILSMPDPNAAGPVAFDPALIDQAITSLTGLAG